MYLSMHLKLSLETNGTFSVLILDCMCCAYNVVVFYLHIPFSKKKWNVKYGLDTKYFFSFLFFFFGTGWLKRPQCLSWTVSKLAQFLHTNCPDAKRSFFVTVNPFSHTFLRWLIKNPKRAFPSEVRVLHVRRSPPRAEEQMIEALERNLAESGEPWALRRFHTVQHLHRWLLKTGRLP